MSDRGALSGPLVGISFIGGVGAAIALSDLPYPRPGSDAAQIRRYFKQSAPRVSATRQLLCAASLVPFTASVARLAGRPGRHSRGLRAVAVAGGGLALISLATAGLHAAVLTRRHARADTKAVALHRRAFLAGGPIHGAGFGLLLGTLGLAGRRTGDLPPALAISALASAVPNLLSPLYLLAHSAVWQVPAGRFLLVTGVAGVRLSRRSTPDSRDEDREVTA